MQSVFLGIDMSTHAQARKGKTQMAVAESRTSGIHLVSLAPLLDDQALLSFLTSTPFLGCGVDAPLSLPPCILCRDCLCRCTYESWSVRLGYEPSLAYHYRLSDLLIRKTIPHVVPKPPLSHGGPVDITPLTLRWLRLSRTLYTQQIPLQRVVEVYATGAIQLLAQISGLIRGERFPYRTSREARAALLCALAEQHWLSASANFWDILVDNEDALDATVACLCAWMAQHRRILQPAALLGLDSYAPSWMVQPLQGDDVEERQAMLSSLQHAPWVALPDPACF